MPGLFFAHLCYLGNPKTSPMPSIFTRFFFSAFFLLVATIASAQLNIVSQSTAQVLAQRLVGDGVTISNAVLRADSRATGFFTNAGGTNIGIDSGIVLTNGRAKTQGTSYGLDGPQTSTATLDQVPVNHGPGDWDLAHSIGEDSANTHDATILEFDFVPLGDSIKFRYVMSSEEYTSAFVCDYNDAFAFFISGPGITGLRNIALVPGTNTPVSIRNVNNIVFTNNCINNPSYYVSNLGNTFLTHNGHTVVLTALERVQPCQVYHMKLVIADVGDGAYDSGVFLEARSLTSNSVQLTNLTQTDASGMSYLVEGCATGSVKIKRTSAATAPQTIYFNYGGSALNTVDVQTLPASITIPAGQDEVFLSIVPLIDNLPEGIEYLKIYTVAPCAAAIPTDSTIIQIRDYDILQLSPGMHPDTAFICRNSGKQLMATTGFSTYTWDTDPTLSSGNTRTPIVTPVNNFTKYYCTAVEGTCHARDSINVKWKDLELGSVTDINCAGSSTGQIRLLAGHEWQAPLEFSIGNQPYQPDSNFNNLPVGIHVIKIRDASGCVDSIAVTLDQAYPTLLSDLVPVQPSCTGGTDGSITVNASGGKPPYSYSINGTTYQTVNFFNAGTGSYTLYVKDANNCVTTKQQTLTFINTVTLAAINNPPICDSKSDTLRIQSNADSYQWTPAATLSNSNIFNPVASPRVTTKYYVTATTGVCFRKDSVTVTVLPAPIANAGADGEICFGGTTRISGSGGVAFSWTPSTYLSSANNQEPFVIRPVVNTTYYLHVTDANGCKSLIPDTVNIKVTPAVRISAGRDTIVAINQPLQLRATELGNSGVTSYTWSPVYGLNDPNIAMPVTTLDRDIQYVVTGRTPLNCEGSDTINIKVYKGPDIYVPTAFTPNSDGRNDLLRAIAIGMKEYHYFRIYNRYGELIFATADFNKGWDGKYKGKEQNTGTFIWLAEAVDYRGNVIQRKGSTSIIR
ncbi:MAG: hypothetical protein JWQ27_1958 [Ferruginibacter sp.]|nr:hypothetical protein [Ferruginibacter sp.]